MLAIHPRVSNTGTNNTNLMWVASPSMGLWPLPLRAWPCVASVACVVDVAGIPFGGLHGSVRCPTLLVDLVLVPKRHANMKHTAKTPGKSNALC